MKEKLNVAGWVMLICGVILSIYLAYSLGTYVDFTYGSHVYYERNWVITIAYFVGGCIGSYITSLIFWGMAEILDALDAARRDREDRNSAVKDELKKLKETIDIIQNNTKPEEKAE